MLRPASSRNVINGRLSFLEGCGAASLQCGHGKHTVTATPKTRRTHQQPVEAELTIALICGLLRLWGIPLAVSHTMQIPALGVKHLTSPRRPRP